uniref:Uncharacterized protein n=1 Tax=Glossina palpalis gambiensis TaxID=67801 RepID=A0A1B0BA16_9MUSC
MFPGKGRLQSHIACLHLRRYTTIAVLLSSVCNSDLIASCISPYLIGDASDNVFADNASGRPGIDDSCRGEGDLKAKLKQNVSAIYLNYYLIAKELDIVMRILVQLVVFSSLLRFVLHRSMKLN